MIRYYVAAGFLLLCIASSLLTGWWVRGLKEDSDDLKIERAAIAAGKASDARWAEKVGTLRPIYQTINKGIERETIRETRYAECVHTDASWGLLLDAYAAQDGSKPAHSGVPGPETAR